jgi:hypothetical protein
MNFDAGFVKIPRTWWTMLANAPAPRLKVWLYIALNANIRESRFLGRTVRPGQLIRSIKTISMECHVSTQQTRNALDNIRMANVATIETTNQYSVITLLDWNTYSGKMGEEEQTKKQAKEQAPQQTNNKRNNNNIRSKKSSSSTTVRSEKENQYFGHSEKQHAEGGENSVFPMGDDDEAIAADPDKALRELFLKTVCRPMDKRLRQKIQDALLLAGVGLPAYITELKIRIPLLREKVRGGFFLQQAREFGETAETEVQKRSMAVDITTAKVLSMQPPKVTVAPTEGCGCTGGMLMQNGQYGYCSCEKGAELKRKESKKAGGVE